MKRRKACSAVSIKFCLAFSGFMASSSVEIPRRIGKNASMPFLLHSVASFVTLPAKASTGMSNFLANPATPTGALPMAVWKSSLPSPVTTTSASLTKDSSFVSSRTILIPDSRTALVNVRNANPQGRLLRLSPAHSHRLSEIFPLQELHNSEAIYPSP